ncbi:hypothetical protein A4A49_61139, partial [Nicotiana attenuata]
RYTIIGKFLTNRPNIKRIRSVFAERVSLKGDVKIGVYDFRIVFIDVRNDDGCKIVWFKRPIEVDSLEQSNGGNQEDGFTQVKNKRNRKTKNNQQQTYASTNNVKKEPKNQIQE